MYVKTFLTSLLNKEGSRLPSVVSFEGEPRIFLRFIRNYIRNDLKESISTIDLYEIDSISIHSQLYMTFLGQSKWFVLIHYGQCSAKKQKKINELVQHYSGPHRILFCNTSDKNIAEPITVHRIDRELIQLLNAIIFRKQAKALHIPSFFDTHTDIGLDQLCLILTYIHVLGKKSDIFFDTWGEHVIANEQSLFTLSGYFFARQKKQFLNIWSKVYFPYSDAFWITFWGEQLWQAMSYLDTPASAYHNKKLLNRLPFSFKQRHWRSYKMEELVNAHQYLYFLDHAMKHGYPDWGIELFLFMFLDKQFNVSRVR